MNKRIHFAATAITSLIIAYSSIAQTMNYVREIDPKISRDQTLKDGIPPGFPTVIGGRLNEIKSNAVRDFAKRFKNVNGEKWYTTPNEYIVEFEKNDTRYTIFYTKKGYWQFTKLVYPKEQLLFSIRSGIKKKFADFEIFNVEEIQSNIQPTVYFIHIKKKENTEIVKTISVKNDEMNELEYHDGKWRIKRVFELPN